MVLVLTSILLIFSNLFMFIEKYSAIAEDNNQFVAWKNDDSEIRLSAGKSPNKEKSSLVYSIFREEKFSTFEEKENLNYYQKVAEKNLFSLDQINKLKKIIYNGYGNERLRGNLTQNEFRDATQYAIWSIFTPELLENENTKLTSIQQQFIKKVLSEEDGTLETPESLRLNLYQNEKGSFLIDSQLIDSVTNSKVELSNIYSTVYARKDWTEFDDDNTTLELQSKTTDGRWETANVKNANQTVEITEEGTPSSIVWENIPGYPTDYRVVEKKSEYKDLISISGKGTLNDPFVILRTVPMNSETVSDRFLRSSSNSTRSSKTGKFTLKKRDENGNILAGAKFTLANESSVIQEKFSDSNPNGIVFDNIPTGTYTLKETQAPAGYEVLKDYYSIKVDQYGIATATYIQVDSERTGSGSDRATTLQPISVRTAKTSGVVEVTNYNLTSTDSTTNHNGIEGVWATSGELIRLTFDLKVKSDARPGDSFTIKLDEKLSPTGIRERILPPVPLTANGEVVATGIYNEESNSFIYTFTDYIRTHKNVTLSATYNTFGADISKVLNTGEYTFTNTIDGQQQTAKKFYIDYGASREMPSGINKGLKMRNQVSYVDRVNGVVERIIYLNSGNTSNDVVSNLGVNHNLELINNSKDSTITNVEVYRVPLSKKSEYMTDSMSGKVDGLEKLSNVYNTNTHKIPINKTDFDDKETGKKNSGLLIKITEKLSNLRGETNMTAWWGYNVGRTAVGASASVVDTGASSSGDAERWSPTISMINKKTPEKKEFSLKILKRDGVDENKENLRATFGLYNEGGNTLIQDKDGKNQTGQTEGKDSSLNFKNIKPGTYTLKETTAPEGYHKVKDIKIVIDENGNITVASEGKDFVSIQKADSDSVITIIVKNIKKGEYPQTGGIGSHIFIFGGMLLVIISIYNRRYLQKN